MLKDPLPKDLQAIRSSLHTVTSSSRDQRDRGEIYKWSMIEQINYLLVSRENSTELI